MPKLLVFEELQLLLKVSPRSTEVECRAMRRVLRSREWMKGLQSLVREYVSRSPELRRLSVTVSR